MTLDREKYDAIREKLDSMGYQFHFPPDSLLLVEQLTNHLADSKNRLQHYESKLFGDQTKDIGVDRFRKDNARLLNDNLDLCKKLDALDEKHELDIKSLKFILKTAKDENNDLEFIHEQNLNKIKQLEQDIVLRDVKILELTSQGSSVSITGKRKHHQNPILEISNVLDKKKIETKIVKKVDVDLVKIMETRAANLTKDVKILTEDNCKLSDLVVELKKQVRSRDNEIARLRNALQGGRPTAALPDPCCCSCQQKDALIESLERQCQDAIRKQHEAMSRALQLAERNEILDRELKDLGKMATSLEETYKRDSRQKEMEIMQQRLEVSQRELKEVENRLKETKEKLENESKTVENLKRAKKNAEMDFNTEKKILNEKINKLIAAEQELKQDVDRLQAANQTLRRKWNEQNSNDCNSLSCPCKCSKNQPWTSKRLRDKIEPKICGCAPTLLLLDKIQQERDYFHQLLQDRIPRVGKEDDSLKFRLERAERERDIAVADLRRAQEDPYRVNDHSRHFGNPVDNRLEKQCEDYRLQLRSCQAELNQVNALYTQLKNFCDQTDRSLTGSQTRLTQLEGELLHAGNRIRDLEKLKWELEERISVLSREKTAIGQNLAQAVKENDTLVAALDEKTEKLARLENEMLKRERQVAEATDQINQAHKKFELTLSEKTTRDHAYRTLELTLDRVRQELNESLADVEKLKIDNRSLQEQLSAALRDGHDAHKEVEMSRMEVGNLKRQLQQYVTEVKRAEELISEKEKAQNDLMANFNTLSLEANSLENSNHTLETEMEVSKMTVIELTRQVHELNTQLENRNGLITEYEKQINSLTQHIAELEAKLEMKNQLCQRLEKDLNAMNELCSALDKQHEESKSRSFSTENETLALSREVRRLSQENNGLNDTLKRDRSEIEALRESLNNSRQETLKHQSKNSNLTTLVHELKKKVDELTTRLESEMKSVHQYEDECRKLNTEVKELRRDMTNRLYDTATSSASRHAVQNNADCPCVKFCIHVRLKEDDDDSDNGTEDHAWDVPLLPMPRSSDISPVSSDMYFSPLDPHFDCCHEAGCVQDLPATYRVLDDQSSSNGLVLSTIEENTLSEPRLSGIGS